MATRFRNIASSSVIFSNTVCKEFLAVVKFKITSAWIYSIYTRGCKTNSLVSLGRLGRYIQPYVCTAICIATTKVKKMQMLIKQSHTMVSSCRIRVDRNPCSGGGCKKNKIRRSTGITTVTMTTSSHASDPSAKRSGSRQRSSTPPSLRCRTLCV